MYEDQSARKGLDEAWPQLGVRKEGEMKGNERQQLLNGQGTYDGAFS